MHHSTSLTVPMVFRRLGTHSMTLTQYRNGQNFTPLQKLHREYPRLTSIKSSHFGTIWVKPQQRQNLNIRRILQNQYITQRASFWIQLSLHLGPSNKLNDVHTRHHIRSNLLRYLMHREHRYNHISGQQEDNPQKLINTNHEMDLCLATQLKRGRILTLL